MVDKSDFLSELEARESSIGVVGLGYVGLPLAVALAHKFAVTGYDVSAERIRQIEKRAMEKMKDQLSLA